MNVKRTKQCLFRSFLFFSGLLIAMVTSAINRKTFCDAFPNHFVSILHLLTQNELRFFIHFPTLLKGFSKSI